MTHFSLSHPDAEHRGILLIKWTFYDAVNSGPLPGCISSISEVSNISLLDISRFIYPMDFIAVTKAIVEAI